MPLLTWPHYIFFSPRPIRFQERLPWAVNCGTIDSETEVARLTECPSCQTIHEGQPRLCENCGYQFASNPKANTIPRKKLTPAQTGTCLSALAIVVALVMFGHRTTPQENPTKSPASSLDNSTRRAPATGQKTPLQERVAAALEREAEAEGAEATLPDQVRKAEVGVTTTIVGPGAEWPCASSRLALKELMEWQKAALDEQQPNSVMENYADALMRTRSIMVGARARVIILDKASGVRRISVIDRARYGFWPGYQAVTAQGCWIAAEAVVR
jgi:hypothetical protein